MKSNNIGIDDDHRLLKPNPIYSVKKKSRKIFRSTETLRRPKLLRGL